MVTHSPAPRRLCRPRRQHARRPDPGRAPPRGLSRTPRGTPESEGRSRADVAQLSDRRAPGPGRRTRPMPSSTSSAWRIGLAACLMLLLYVRYETSYDKWLPDADRTPTSSRPGSRPSETGERTRSCRCRPTSAERAREGFPADREASSTRCGDEPVFIDRRRRRCRPTIAARRRQLLRRPPVPFAARRSAPTRSTRSTMPVHDPSRGDRALRHRQRARPDAHRDRARARRSTSGSPACSRICRSNSHVSSRRRAHRHPSFFSRTADS